MSNTDRITDIRCDTVTGDLIILPGILPPFETRRSSIVSRTITDFFAKVLNAPLHSPLWSWGAENNEAVFLRCWQHEKINLDGKTWGLHVDGYEGYVGVTDNNGLNERRKHLESVKAGKPVFVVMCLGDQAAAPGADKIRKYNDREIFIGGAIRTLDDGRVVLDIVGKKPVTRVVRV